MSTTTDSTVIDLKAQALKVPEDRMLAFLTELGTASHDGRTFELLRSMDGTKLVAIDRTEDGKGWQNTWSVDLRPLLEQLVRELATAAIHVPTFGPDVSESTERIKGTDSGRVGWTCTCGASSTSVRGWGYGTQRQAENGHAQHRRNAPEQTPPVPEVVG